MLGYNRNDFLGPKHRRLEFHELIVYVMYPLLLFVYLTICMWGLTFSQRRGRHFDRFVGLLDDAQATWDGRSTGDAEMHCSGADNLCDRTVSTERMVYSLNYNHLQGFIYRFVIVYQYSSGWWSNIFNKIFSLQVDCATSVWFPPPASSPFLGADWHSCRSKIALICCYSNSQLWQLGWRAVGKEGTRREKIMATEQWDR